jgi:hypothetical protein
MELGSERCNSWLCYKTTSLYYTCKQKTSPCTTSRPDTQPQDTCRRITEAGFDLENYVSFSYQPEQGLDGWDIGQIKTNSTGWVWTLSKGLARRACKLENKSIKYAAFLLATWTEKEWWGVELSVASCECILLTTEQFEASNYWQC